MIKYLNIRYINVGRMGTNSRNSMNSPKYLENFCQKCKIIDILAQNSNLDNLQLNWVKVWELI